MEPANDDVVEELRSAVHAVCEKMGGVSVARALLNSPTVGFDADAWRTLGHDVGIASIALPEHIGGMGGAAELVAVAEELGAWLMPVPFLGSTVLAGQILAHCGPGADPALERLAAGTAAAVAVADDLTTWDSSRAPLQLNSQARISGTVSAVIDAVGAEILVAATADAVVVLDTDSPGVEITPLHTLDLTRSIGSITVTDAECVVVGHDPDSVIPRALSVATLSLAAEQLGGAQRCLDMTVAYVMERRQFARPIGSFQAIKHILADCLVKVEMARSAISRAVGVSNDPSALAEAALVARIWCSEAFRSVSSETIQLHGGIGFTWDHDAHLYFRRARADAVMLGTVADCRERLAEILGWQNALA